MMKTLSVGIGCRLQSSAAQIDAAVQQALGPTLTLDDIAVIATIDAKANEPGLIEFCTRHALPLRFFSREQIAALSDASVRPSAAAQTHLGVDGVSEPCAMLASAGGQLLAPKIARDGVTVAIASNPYNDSKEQDLP